MAPRVRARLDRFKARGESERRVSRAGLPRPARSLEAAESSAEWGPLMGVTLAFDVYGTLIDTAGVSAALRAHAGDEAGAFARVWRDTQLEYAFRRGLMGQYRPFPVCTRQALDYTCELFHVQLTEPERDQLMAGYRKLPAFPDVAPALADLAATDHCLFAFSNGPVGDVRALLAHANVEQYFDAVISVDDVRSFKPDPEVYRHFLRCAQAEPAHAWLVSSNSFDVMGALAVGMRAAWVKRAPHAVFDPWEFTPTVTVSNLGELAPALGTAP